MQLVIAPQEFSIQLKEGSSAGPTTAHLGLLAVDNNRWNSQRRLQLKFRINLPGYNCFSNSTLCVLVCEVGAKYNDI